MASGLQIPGDESVLLRVTHSNIKSFSADMRFSLQVSTTDSPYNSYFFTTVYVLSV